MIAARLRECLKVLRWTEADLAEELGVPAVQVHEWLAGRAYVPVAVAAWLEALVKAHRRLPRPVIDAESRFTRAVVAGSDSETGLQPTATGRLSGNSPHLRSRPVSRSRQFS